MSNLRRFFKQGDIVFITIVTYNRNRIIIENIELLRNAILSIQNKSQFEVIAYIYLDDHIHLLIDSKENDLIKIIQSLKMSFGTQYRIKNEMKSGRVWQNRYWDHIIRDHIDMNNHIDYIYYNPVKHGLVKSPFAWKFSSINDYKDLYQKDWGNDEILFDENFGE